MTAEPELPSGEASGDGEHGENRKSRKLPRLSLGARLVALVVGWGLLLVGFAGLALPGIQGVLTLLAGTAVLSVASETVYRLLRWLFRRWPRGWKRVRSFRRKVHGWLNRAGSGDGSDD